KRAVGDGNQAHSRNTVDDGVGHAARHESSADHAHPNRVAFGCATFESGIDDDHLGYLLLVTSYLLFAGYKTWSASWGCHGSFVIRWSLKAVALQHSRRLLRRLHPANSK